MERQQLRARLVLVMVTERAWPWMARRLLLQAGTGGVVVMRPLPSPWRDQHPPVHYQVLPQLRVHN